MKYFSAVTVGLLLSLTVFNSNASVVNSTKSGAAVNAKPVLVNKKSSAMPLVSEPKITIDDKASELNQLLNWCNHNEGTGRALVNDEYSVYGFVLNKGTLQSNMALLVDSFYPNFQGFINRTNNHRVIGEKCILGRSKREVIQPIVQAYFYEKQPILFATFENDIAAMFYKNDEVMSKYLRIR